MKISVLGGGNMGSILSVKFSQKYDVTLFLNNPYERLEEYHKDMLVYNEDGNFFVKGKINRITEDLSEAISDADWIFVTFPSFLFESFAKRIIPLLHRGQHLVGIPGSGGFELYFREALNKGVTITGLQRVHSVARIITKGEEVRESGVRKAIRCASIPASFNNTASKFLSDFYSLQVEKLDNYLNVTLLNSNPILHTSRLYTIYKDFLRKKEYDSLPLFYEEWSLESSKLLEKMDEELFSVFGVLGDNGLPVNQVTTILKHYESTNASEMTKKINSINSLKGLTTPSKINENGKYIPDLSSRYFTADFPYGLDILLSFSRLLCVDAPNMEKVSNWYHQITNTERTFDLRDFGLNDIESLKQMYSK